MAETDKEPPALDAAELTGWRLPPRLAKGQRFVATMAAQRHDPEHAETYADLLKAQAEQLDRAAGTAPDDGGS